MMGGMSESNVELARRGYEAAVHGDLAVLREFLDPQVKWHGGDPSAATACQNREQALEVIAEASRRGGIGELVDVLDAGEQVLVVMRPAPIDSEPAGLIANLTSFRDGKAVEMVHYPDPEHARAAAGI